MVGKEFSIYHSPDIGRTRGYDLVPTETQEHLMADYPVELLDNLDAAKREAFTRRRKELVFRDGAYRKKTYDLVAATTGDGKTGIITQDFEEWDKDAEVKQLEAEKGEKVRRYYLNLGMSLACARRAGLVVSPQGKISPEEYAAASNNAYAILSLAEQYLADPAIITLEGVPMTAFTDRSGKLRGVDRLYSTMQRIIANKHALMRTIVAPDTIAIREMERRESIKHALSEDEVISRQKESGIIDDRTPIHVKQFYQQTGNWDTRQQQHADINKNMYWLIRREEMSPPYFTVKRPRSFNAYRKQRIDYMEHAFLPEWLKRFYQTSHVPEDAVIFRNNPVERSQQVHMYGNHLEKANLLNALVRQAKKTGDQMLDKALYLYGVHSLITYPNPRME